MGEPEVAREVVARWPETVASALDPVDPVASLPQRVAAWVIGPGRGLHPQRSPSWKRCSPVTFRCWWMPTLTLLARNPALVRAHSPTLLTPHAGELTRLLPGVERADVRRTGWTMRGALPPNTAAPCW